MPLRILGRIIFTSLILSTLPALSAFSQETETHRVRDARGLWVEITGRAERIVSLTPTATELLFALDAGNQVLGVTEYCNYPAETLEKPKVGGFSGATVSVERIAALKPDLIIISRDVHVRLEEMLRELKLRTFALEPQSLEDIYSDIQKIGILTGHEKKSEILIQDMKNRLEKVQKRIPQGPRPKVFWMLWDEPLMTSGSGTFINEAIFLAGGYNIFSDLPESWPTISLEQLILRNPDWIITGNDHGYTMDHKVLSQRNIWSELEAVKEGRVAEIDSDIINRGGPRFIQAIEALADLLY